MAIKVSTTGTEETLWYSDKGVVNVTIHQNYRFTASTEGSKVEGTLLEEKLLPDSAKITGFSPQIFMTKENKAIFESKDYSKIQQLKDKAQNDLAPLYENIKRNGSNAFVKVERNNQEYYITYGKGGTIWSWSKEIPSPTGDTAKAYHVQIGSYSQSSSMLGINSYVISNLPIQFTAALVSLGFTILLKELIAEGIGYAVAFICLKLAQALASLGWEAAVVQVSSTVVSVGATLLTAFLGILIFFAILVIASYLWVQYDLLVEIYNFDPSSDWSTASNDYMDNAVIPGIDYYAPLTVPKYIPPNNVITPPGFEPITNLDGVVGYMTYVFENDSKFLEGLIVALQVSNQAGNQSFMIKYNLDRFRNNRIGLKVGTEDLSNYVKNDPWVNGLNTQIVVGNLNVSATTDYQSGAPHNVYNLIVNIGTSQ